MAGLISQFRVGDVVEDVKFLDPAGRPIPIPELGNGPLLFVFLRHLV